MKFLTLVSTENRALLALKKHVAGFGGLSFMSKLFLCMVFIPVFASTFYYSFSATDRYVSEAIYVVRGLSQQQQGGLASVLSTFGLSTSQDNTFSVLQYLQSRDAVRSLDQMRPLRGMFSKPSIDFLSRYPRLWRSDTFEALYGYYLDRVQVFYTTSTGMSTIRAVAFSPEEAKFIADSLLQLSEKLVNRINERAISDAVSFAKKEVALAEEKVISTQGAITSFRNCELMLDPSAQSLKIFDLIGQLTGDIAQTRIQLSETLASAPSSPSIQSLKVRIASLEEQIASERAKIVGGNDALATKVAEFERLSLARGFADKNLAGAFAALELARQQGQRMRLYIETVVAPNYSDELTEPRATRLIACVFLVTFVFFCLLWLVITGSKEHQHG